MESLQGFRCWAVGWGVTQLWKDGTEQLSTYLKSAGVNFMRRDYCLAHSYYDLISSDHICAGKKPIDGETNDGDIGATCKDGGACTADGGAGCKGDEGGPLICDIFGQATLVGIQDGYDAENCGNKGYPTKYLDVSTVQIITRKFLSFTSLKVHSRSG